MTETQLSNALGDHVYRDFRIRNNFGGGFDQIWVHNLLTMTIRLTELDSETEWGP